MGVQLVERVVFEKRWVVGGYVDGGGVSARVIQSGKRARVRLDSLVKLLTAADCYSSVRDSIGASSLCHPLSLSDTSTEIRTGAGKNREFLRADVSNDDRFFLSFLGGSSFFIRKAAAKESHQEPFQQACSHA